MLKLWKRMKKKKNLRIALEGPNCVLSKYRSFEPFGDPERVSAAGSISVTIKIWVQIQTFHLFLMHIIA